MRTADFMAWGIGLLGTCLIGCRSERPEPTPAKPQAAHPSADAERPGEAKLLAAAGVEMQLPSTWTIVPETEANFGMAIGPSGVASRSPVCTIELRRQGAGPLPVGVKQSQSSKRGATDYSRGPLRGRLLELPGERVWPSSSVVVHCMDPHLREWGAIDAAFDSLEHQPIEPKMVATPPGPTIAELCTGTPARRTYVCARKTDGAVYCGESSGEVMTRVAVPSAVELACEGARVCTRADAGEVHCWTAGGTPELVASVGAARDLAGSCIVDERGAVMCRHHQLDGREGLAELLPLGDPALARRDVERVLEGSTESSGCTIEARQPWCWGDGRPPALVAGAVSAREITRIGERLCVAEPEPEHWNCLDPEAGAGAGVEDCSDRPCGCTLIGVSRFSCEHEQPERIDSFPLGRVADVIAVDHACVALRDGSVLCRGPVTGQREDSPRAAALVAGNTPGVAHLLELREAETGE